MRKPFEDVVLFQEGPGVRNWQFKNEGIKLINIKNIVNDELLLENTSNFLSFDEVNTKYKHFLLDEGDFVMASSGVTWGKIAEIKKEHLPLCLNTSIIRLRVKDEKVMDKWFLYYFIKSNKFKNQIKKLITGSAQPNFGPSHLKKVFIEYPDIKMQKKYVESLNVLLEIIKNRQQQMDKLNEIIKSQFVEMFENKDFEKVELKSVSEVKGRVGWKGYTKADLRDSGPLVLGATHLSDDGLIDLSEPVYLSKEKYEESPEIMIEKNDIIFAQRGSLGKIGLVKNDIGEATINPCVLILRPNNINPEFFRYLLIMEYDNGNLARLNSGSTIPMISQKTIGEFKIILPDKNIQNKFAEFVNQIDKQKFEIEKSLKEMQELYESLMDKYFG